MLQPNMVSLYYNEWYWSFNAETKLSPLYYGHFHGSHEMKASCSSHMIPDAVITEENKRSLHTLLSAHFSRYHKYKIHHIYKYQYHLWVLNETWF